MGLKSPWKYWVFMCPSAFDNKLKCHLQVWTLCKCHKRCISFSSALRGPSMNPPSGLIQALWSHQRGLWPLGCEGTWETQMCVLWDRQTQKNNTIRQNSSSHLLQNWRQGDIPVTLTTLLSGQKADTLKLAATKEWIHRNHMDPQIWLIRKVCYCIPTHY